MYDERLGKIHFWTASSPSTDVLPHALHGLAGMPRRIVDYSLQFADFNMVSSIGARLLGLTQVFFLYIVIKTIRGGEPATDQVWEGAEGLEWTIPSPAPLHTFETPPEFPPATGAASAQSSDH